MKAEALDIISKLKQYIENDVLSLNSNQIECIMHSIHDLEDTIAKTYDVMPCDCIPSSFEEYAKQELANSEKNELYRKLYGYDDQPTSYPTDVFLKPKNVIEQYNDLPIKPIIKSVDLNNEYKKEFDEYDKPKTAYVIGLDIKF